MIKKKEDKRMEGFGLIIIYCALLNFVIALILLGNSSHTPVASYPEIDVSFPCKVSSEGMLCDFSDEDGIIPMGYVYREQQLKEENDG